MILHCSSIFLCVCLDLLLQVERVGPFALGAALHVASNCGPSRAARTSAIAMAVSSVCIPTATNVNNTLLTDIPFLFDCRPVKIAASVHSRKSAAMLEDGTVVSWYGTAPPTTTSFTSVDEVFAPTSTWGTLLFDTAADVDDL